MRILARELFDTAKNSPDTEIEIMGWVHRIRDMGGVNFIILRDRSGLCQLVLNEKAGFHPESVIRAKGVPVLDEKAPLGAELRVNSIEVLSPSRADLPFQVNADISKTGLESILDNRTLSLRNLKIRSIFKVQATIIEAFGAYLRGQDFTEIKTSKLVNSATEGGAGLFEVEYFDRKLCLAQSPQAYKETMVAAGLERVFEIAPAYRAEKHDTPRHLNEYVSLDVEMGFIESELELIELERGLLTYIFEQVAYKNSEDLAAWDARVPAAAQVALSPVVPYDEALQLANDEAARNAGNNKAARIFDINPEAERLICEWSAREKGSDIVFVNEFPRRYRPFYTYPKGTAGTMSFDALFRGLEITTGGRRQDNYEELLEILPRFGLKEENMRGYLTIFKYGAPPHGGFAIGCERLTQKILGLANVKEASLFPRDRKRFEP
ncbi:MAG: aspartate--tRNA(Asn) ligase [Treponema sp.]|jgi:nondiscriminating aspartyl-tRNA synthetase|nr:aspartate--tRNA(Asn) ligase [Treponema sp.]